MPRSARFGHERPNASGGNVNFSDFIVSSRKLSTMSGYLLLKFAEVEWHATQSNYGSHLIFRN